MRERLATHARFPRRDETALFARDRFSPCSPLRQWIAAEPAIQQTWHVTGDGGYVLIVAARNVDDCDALMQRLVAANANMKRFRTRVALDTVKRVLAVPVDALPA